MPRKKRHTVRRKRRHTPTPLAGLKAMFKAAGYPTICIPPGAIRPYDEPFTVESWRKYLAEQMRVDRALRKKGKRRSRSI